MKKLADKLPAFPMALTAPSLGLGSTSATATMPWDDFGECKVLIEVNASDGAYY